MSIIDAYLRLVARWRWSFLLALLIGSFVLQAILPNGPVTRLTGFTLFMLIFGGALYAGRTGRRAARAAIALLLATTVLQILNVLGVAALEVPLAALALTIVFGALVATFAELVGNRDSTSDSLVGAIFGYFVIATACALLFRQMEGAHPGSFRLPEGGDLDTQMLYFSLITVTTAGYGDITPVTSLAQISAALEAALGTLYLAILIGRIAEVRLRASSSEKAGNITSAATAAPASVPPGLNRGGGQRPGGAHCRKQREGEIKADDGQHPVQAQAACDLLGLAGGHRQHDGEGLEQHPDRRAARNCLQAEGVGGHKSDEADHQIGVLAQHAGDPGEGERQQRKQQRQHHDAAKGGGAGIFRVKVANSIAATKGSGAPIHTAAP